VIGSTEQASPDSGHQDPPGHGPSETLLLVIWCWGRHDVLV